MLLLSSADFSELTFSKNTFKNTVRVSNSSFPDQDRRPVGPDLGPNCLQRLWVTKVAASKERVIRACALIRLTVVYGSNEFNFECWVIFHVFYIVVC